MVETDKRCDTAERRVFAAIRTISVDVGYSSVSVAVMEEIKRPPRISNRLAAAEQDIAHNLARAFGGRDDRA